MELFFLVLLIVLLAWSLGSGYPVAFAIPGSAILTVAIAAAGGYLFAGDVDAYFTNGGGPEAWLSAGVLNFRGIYRSDERDTLIAIPLFVFMGLMFQRSKVADDLLLAMAQLFGVVRGGLGASVIIVGALLAATTGIVGATVVAMGMISLPTMLRNKYSKPLASGLVAATGTLGQIIPPSIVLLILVQQLTTAVNQAGTERRALYKTVTGELLMPSEFDVFSVSAGEMFMGAFIPGLLLVGLYLLYVLGSAALRPELAPALGDKERGDGRLAVRVLIALVPPLVLILLVLGSIIAGVATVNQAGAIGAAGATVMAGYRLYEGKHGAFYPAIVTIVSLVALGFITSIFNVNLRKIETGFDVMGIVLAAIASLTLTIALLWSGLRTLKIDQTMRKVVEETTKTTSLVFMILLGAVMLTAAFRGFGGEELLRDFLQRLPGGFWGQFTIIMLIIFVLGFFLDFIEITVVVVPIVAPILLADPSANVTAVWLGVMIAMNIQTSFLTPPFGFALFYLRGVAPPSVRTLDIYKGVVPFILIQLLALGIVGAYPALVNYLPTRVLLLAENAPPTTNPRLQYCIETYVSRQFSENGRTIRDAITRARGLDLGGIPLAQQAELVESFDKAENAFTEMTNIETAEQSVADAAVEYRPLLTTARELERDARRIERDIANLEVTVSREGGVVTVSEAQDARDQIKNLAARRDAVLTQMPDNWAVIHADFAAIQTSENNARRAYRRNANDAYGPLAGLISVISGWEDLMAIETELLDLQSRMQSQVPADTVDQIGAIRTTLSKIAGTSEIAAELRTARRALRSNTPDIEVARVSVADALITTRTEIAWRAPAAENLLPDLHKYQVAIMDTIGLRGLPRLPDNVAIEVAACSATPADISLNF
jgi:TRAP-type mannitol/chloroaromatic compound transport system permease large subunit